MALQTRAAQISAGVNGGQRVVSCAQEQEQGPPLAATEILNGRRTNIFFTNGRGPKK